MVTNAEMAKTLREIAFYLDMEEIPFKPRAGDWAKRSDILNSLPLNTFLASLKNGKERSRKKRFRVI